MYKDKNDMAAYHREWYQKNKERRKELNTSWRNKNQEQFQEWKSQQKCKLCGESETSCLDLHHLDPSQKEYSIGSVAREISASKLLKELEKCVVLCANCHRKVHAGVAQLAEQLPCNE